MEDIAVWQVDYAKTGTKALVNGGTKIWSKIFFKMVTSWLGYSP
jgi:hypothetical protein